MILLLDLCHMPESLSRDEFVAPIEELVRQSGLAWTTLHYTGLRDFDFKETKGIILCGTALRDNEFLRHIDEFLWLEDCHIPVLGICAGMQVINLVFGGSLEEESEIGMTDIEVALPDPLFEGKEVFEAYELHTFAIRPPAGLRVLARSRCCVQAVKHSGGCIYGVLFHPEVRNEWVVNRFIQSMCGHI